MPKRSAAVKIQYYTEKIKKLENKKSAKRRRRAIVYSSSDSEENNENLHCERESDNATATLRQPAILTLPPAPSPPIPTPLPVPTPPTASPHDLSNEVLHEPEINYELAPELDPELLQALGDPVDDAPVYGPEIHSTLAQRWLPILRKGIQQDAKDKLLKEYAIPGNCKLLKAPALNAEISAAVRDAVRNRDKNMQAKQNQLGLGITAVNRAMTLLLTGDDRVQAVKILSDGCRILSDLHFVETQVRKKLITPGLEKSFLTVIQDEDRDESLFGEKLAEKIKASKAIEKQGQQIRKPNLKPSIPSASSSSTRPRIQGQFPWMRGRVSGPPRNPSSNRGWRMSSYRTPSRRAPPAILSPLPTTTLGNRRAHMKQ